MSEKDFINKWKEYSKSDSRLIAKIVVPNHLKKEVNILLSNYAAANEVSMCYIFKGLNDVVLYIYFTFEKSKTNFVKQLKLIK